MVLVLCSIMKHGLVTLVVIMILKDSATFQVLFIVSLFCSWNITIVGINRGVYFLESYIHHLFTSGGLGLGLIILVVVLKIWSCLHHWLCFSGTLRYNTVFGLIMSVNLNINKRYNIAPTIATKTICARGDTICPAPFLSPSRRNVAVLSHVEYVPTLTAAAA